ncbi:MAG: UDP-N-acetylmuramoyl-L-alanyl-D-glutamate--2,6-diaminopimelate ligase [Clostridiales bacterium]|nr:UDP-N-acetylmuramoyl-L-alanyl-D-glutamate--2,6-diaminopimelate ligase [Clostridiales bacterium]
MKLSYLAEEAKPYTQSITGDCLIGELSQDSRVKANNSLFFCISGLKHDAHDYIPQAIENGAIAVVTSRPIQGLTVPCVVVSDVRAAMSLMASAFYGHPSRRLRMIGVTGTKGKTTVSYFVKAIMERAGYSCGLIGTTGYMIGNRWSKGALTTPDPIELQRTLRDMVDAGVQTVSMEVSAHAITMHRLEGVSFEAGCFTNLSQDHLDYFKTMEAYFDAKKSFFTSGAVRNAALNVDDDMAHLIMDDIAIPHSTYGICTNADIFARNIEISEDGVQFELFLWNEQVYPARLQMMGMFNVYNALAAVATGLIMGVDPVVICEALASVRSVPGRAEIIETHTPYKVVIDYSHSPDALENILKTVKGFVKNHIILVFGCGGDRDHGKRPRMGEIAGWYADYSILTSDNPRTENPMDILADIERGIKGTQGAYCIIENRREAIRTALSRAQSGDVVILAGKGHETYQEINGMKRPFDEKQIVHDFLNEAAEAGGHDA